MITGRRHHADSLILLLLSLLLLGMIVNSVVHAENYLFAKTDEFSAVIDQDSHYYSEFELSLSPNGRENWLLPSTRSTRTAFRGGMAHIQFDSSDESDISALLPGNTRFTFSMGLEENDLLSSPGSPTAASEQEWYDRYRPMLYLSIGHRW